LIKPTAHSFGPGALFGILLLALTLSSGCGDLLSFGEEPPPAFCPQVDEGTSPEEAALECSDSHPQPG